MASSLHHGSPTYLSLSQEVMDLYGLFVFGPDPRLLHMRYQDRKDGTVKHVEVSVERVLFILAMAPEDLPLYAAGWQDSDFGFNEGVPIPSREIALRRLGLCSGAASHDH